MARKEETSCLERLKDIVKLHPSNVIFDISDGFLNRALENAVPNEEQNSFPGFLFDGGALKHFLIGTLRETGKGSELNGTIPSRPREEDPSHGRRFDCWSVSVLVVDRKTVC